jgi:hypothetical protein
MPRQELEQMLGNNTMPHEQRLFVQWFYTYFDALPAGVNRRIINVVPLYYEGVILGTEFLTYAATKLYIAYDFEIAKADVESNAIGCVAFYSAANALFFSLTNLNSDFAAQLYILNNARTNNLYFSRIVNIGYDLMRFNGYRITLV